MTTIRRWSSSASGDAAVGVLDLVQQSLPVHLIATRRRDFVTCRSEEPLAAAVQRGRAGTFDFLPVVGPGAAGAEPIVGVLHVAGYTSGVSPRDIVQVGMEPLAEAQLIGADASILEFVQDADRHPFRFVVSGREISGLVSLSDLQQLPVRAALFAMVTQFEMSMTDVIRGSCPDEAAWRRHISDERLKALDDKIANARASDTLIDALLYTELGDKKGILKKCWPFPAGASPSKTRFAKDMERIEQLRNNLAHANDFAETREAASQVCEDVRRMNAWIERVARLMREPDLRPVADRAGREDRNGDDYP